jgi:hypothetical protein
MVRCLAAGTGKKSLYILFLFYTVLLRQMIGLSIITVGRLRVASGGPDWSRRRLTHRRCSQSLVASDGADPGTCNRVKFVKTPDCYNAISDPNVRVAGAGRPLRPGSVAGPYRHAHAREVTGAGGNQ